MSEHIDVYPVGVLHALQIIGRVLTKRHPDLRGKRLAIVRREIRKETRYLRHQIKARNWRAVRNSFNGYLAEHRHGGHNCGTGWTKRAAERRADRLCLAALAPDPTHTHNGDHHDNDAE